MAYYNPIHGTNQPRYRAPAHKHDIFSDYDYYKPPSRKAQGRSLLRVVAASILVCAAISLIEQYFFSGPSAKTLQNEAIVLGSCHSLDALRHTDDCWEAIDATKGRVQPRRIQKRNSVHLQGEQDIPWISSYGLVLDYDTVYDRFSTSNDEERYTTKRTLKCLAGSHMSIVWDIQFSTSLMQAYGHGLFGLRSNSTVDDHAIRCPSFDQESAASMSIKINCGFDIKRDGFGNPVDENAHAEVETCMRRAWQWVTTKLGSGYVGPWLDLCKEDDFGVVRCDRSRFHLEGLG